MPGYDVGGRLPIASKSPVPRTLAWPGQFTCVAQTNRPHRMPYSVDRHRGSSRNQSPLPVLEGQSYWGGADYCPKFWIDRLRQFRPDANVLSRDRPDTPFHSRGRTLVPSRLGSFGWVSPHLCMAAKVIETESFRWARRQ